MNYDAFYVNNNYFAPIRPQGYYDPYGYARFMELQRQREQEEKERRMNDFATLARAVNRSAGYEGEELDSRVGEFLNTVDPSRTQDPSNRKEWSLEDVRTLESMRRLSTRSVPDDTAARRRYLAASVQDRLRSKVPKEMSIGDFAAMSGRLASEAEWEKARRNQKDLRSLYDQNEYQRLLRSHGTGSNYFGSRYTNGLPGDNMNDFEIRLPSHLNSEYSKRRESFLRAITGHTNPIDDGYDLPF